MIKGENEYDLLGYVNVVKEKKDFNSFIKIKKQCLVNCCHILRRSLFWKHWSIDVGEFFFFVIENVFGAYIVKKFLLLSFSLSSLPQAFFCWIVGSLLIFILFDLLGSQRSCTECFVAIGYSVAPLALLEPLVALTEIPLPITSTVLKLLGVLWVGFLLILGSGMR